MRRISPTNNVMKINHERKFAFNLTFAPGIEIMDLNNWERHPVTSNERILCRM